MVNLLRLESLDEAQGNVVCVVGHSPLLDVLIKTPQEPRRWCYPISTQPLPPCPPFLFNLKKQILPNENLWLWPFTLRYPMIDHWCFHWKQENNGHPQKTLHASNQKTGCGPWSRARPQLGSRPWHLSTAEAEPKFDTDDLWWPSHFLWYPFLLTKNKRNMLCVFVKI